MLFRDGSPSGTIVGPNFPPKRLSETGPWWSNRILFMVISLLPQSSLFLAYNITSNEV
jgi:hypothetical protein